MNKKQKTILLLVVAAIVWGYTGLKWFNYFSANNEDTVFYEESQSVVPDLIFKDKKDYTLDLNYSDPFLKKNKSKKIVKQYSSSPSNSIPHPNMQQKRNIAKPPPPPVYKWPEMIYSGFILSKGDKLGLLNISGKDILVNQGDVYQNIKIKNIFSDSIQLVHEKEIKTIKKK